MKCLRVIIAMLLVVLEFFNIFGKTENKDYGEVRTMALAWQSSKFILKNYILNN